MSKCLSSTPRKDGYRMPGEFEPQSEVFMIWPERPDNWRDNAGPAQRAYCDVAIAISEFTPVTMLVSAHQYSKARTMLPASIRLVEMSSNDAWCRDSGPTFLVNDNGGIRAVDWTFNAWGGLVDGLYRPLNAETEAGGLSYSYMRHTLLSPAVFHLFIACLTGNGFSDDLHDTVFHFFDRHVGGIDKDRVLRLFKRRDVPVHIAVVSLPDRILDLLKRNGALSLFFDGLLVAAHRPDFDGSGQIDLDRRIRQHDGADIAAVHYDRRLAAEFLLKRDQFFPNSRIG